MQMEKTSWATKFIHDYANEGNLIHDGFLRNVEKIKNELLLLLLKCKEREN